MLAYADDICLVSDSKEDFLHILQVTNDFFNQWHLEISAEKSAVLTYGQLLMLNANGFVV